VFDQQVEDTMNLIIESEPVPLRVDSDGVVRVGGTRVTLDTIVAAFHEGATAEEIVHQYPSLDLADVYGAIGYYLRRRPRVDAYLAERMRAGAEVQRLNEERHDPHGIRDRLLARRTPGG
jgi:uncharacterized protein (DUF433 family)